jgi:hypothetical protein
VPSLAVAVGVYWGKRQMLASKWYSEQAAAGFGKLEAPVGAAAIVFISPLHTLLSMEVRERHGHISASAEPTSTAAHIV